MVSMVLNDNKMTINKSKRTNGTASSETGIVDARKPKQSVSSSCKCCIKGCKKIGIYPLTIGIYLCEEHWRKMVNRTIKSIKL